MLDELYAPTSEGLRYLAFPSHERPVLLVPEKLAKKSRWPRLLTLLGGPQRASLLFRSTSLRLSSEAVSELVERCRVPGATSITFRFGNQEPLSRVVMQFTDPHGRLVGYAKLAVGHLSERALQNEAQTLKGLREIPEMQHQVPTLIGANRWNGHYIISTKPMAGRAGPRQLLSEHGEYVSQLMLASRSSATAEEVIPVHRSEDRAPDERPGVAISRVRAGIIERLGTNQIPVGRAHGDFTHWNSVKTPNGLAFLDWEASIPDAAPGHDLFHFLFMERLGSLPKPTDIARNPVIRAHIKTVWPEGLGLVPDLYGIYLVRRLVTLARIRAEVGPGEGRLWEAVCEAVEKFP